MQWLPLILTEIFLAYTAYSIYDLSLLFVAPSCEEGKPCLMTYLSQKPQLQLQIYSSVDKYPTDRQIDFVYTNENFNYTYASSLPLTLNIPRKTRNNGTLFLHIIIAPNSKKYGKSVLDTQKDPYVSYTVIKMTQYTIPEAEAFNLLGKKSLDPKRKIQNLANPVTHIKSHVTFTVMTDDVNLPVLNVPMELVNHLKIIQGRTFLPIVNYDFLQTRYRDLVKIMPHNNTVNITLQYSPISLGKLRLLLHVEPIMQSLKDLGFSDKNIDEVKGILADTNIYVLGGAVFITVIHLLFDFLAFKNDVSYWRRKDNLVGLSKWTVIWQAFSQTVIFLYLVNEGLSLLVLIPCGIGSLIESANSILFYGTDKTRNSLFIKFSHKAFKIAELSLQLTTADGQLYVLPAYPDTTLVSSLNQEWTAAGLKIEFLQFQRRWRIIYNGILRNFTKGDECSDENVEHIRLNFIFIANSQPLRWPEDWSSKLHAEALACEPWKSPQWMNKIKLLDYTGFDQWGSMIGQITYKDGSVSALYLRGLHQHRWGKHESHEFHESVTLFGIMSYGAMYYLNMSSTKNSFPQIQFGQYRNNSEDECKIDKIGLTLSDFMSAKFNPNSDYKTWFTAENKRYNILIKPKNSIKFYYGEPWNWQSKIVNVKLEINGQSGTGLIQLWSPYNGPCQGKVHSPLQFLKQVNMLVQRKDYVVYFNDRKCQNENIVGGKGFSLAMLTSVQNADFVVPKGFCVTVFALELQLHMHKELQKIINDIEDVSVGKKDGDLQNYCEEAMHIIESTPIVEEVKGAIVKAIENLESENDNDKPSKYAVRSSAVGEDSEETSAAGQNSTYLGIQGIDNIIKSIAMCWASLFSYQSVEYRKQHGIFIKSSMSVCVQKMVNADAAGVMFTRHPTTGDPSNIIITANYGLGESVVSATVEPDTIIVHKSWNNELTIKSSFVGNKKKKILTGDNGVVTMELNEQENKTVCVSKQIALRLADIGVNLETLFGSARDIEWAVVKENIYLLQARPITTLYSWTDFELTHELDTSVPSDIDIITFANVGEVFPNPMSPLTISVIIGAFETGICNAFHIANRIFFTVVGMKCAINYYNMFLQDPSKKITLLNKVIDIAVCGNLVVTPEIHKVSHGTECHMHTSRVSITYQIFAMALLTKGYKDLIPEHFSDIALLLGSCSDIVSAEMLTSLKKIVIYIKKNEKDEEFKKVDPKKGINWLKVNCPSAAKELDSLLKEHGHRCIQEMDFLSEPWSLRPENLITTLQTMMAIPGTNKLSKTLSAEETVAQLKTPKSTITKWLLKKLVPRCRKAVVDRELTKAIFVSIVHTFRLAYRGLGKLMALEGYLPSEDLIFFLTHGELGQMLTHHNRTLVQKAFRRKRNFPRLKDIKYPEINIGMPIPEESNLNMVVDDKSIKIQGTPVCGGSVLNRACVITDLGDAQKIQPGDILITHSTDIAWSPYFPLLSGIVTELGGLISHGAVVAREYGLPCIVGVKKATQIFQTGDTVLLAADAGALQLVKKHD
ncbi:Cleft lip and palate transmembrane protein 1-like protein [Habropoda laboriosa]|uniref:Cleft lip and palate transmembrane protein 1-like protein n=1 Tax=Habropoda laboriosa TaxID=597456 RepID=A0A0L7QV50_9HYME|nr:Cleft lip and palate transmembrane protein 1-like protein [Habropoda laboriosa]